MTGATTVTSVPTRTLSRARHEWGFWFVASAFFVLMAFGTLPTPLWPLYQLRDHFGTAEVTIAFAVMVVGAAGSFIGLGHLSDRFGRRRIVVPSLLVGIAAAAIMALWPDLPGLIIGRVLTGVAVGLMASTATAYLSDLHRQARPDAARSQFPVVVAAVANLGGLATGPLVAGVLAQWGPEPLRAPYLYAVCAFVVLFGLIMGTPETVDRDETATAARFALRPGMRGQFAAGSAVGFIAFAVMGLFSSLGAVIVHGRLGVTAPVIIGLAPFSAFAASAVIQFVLGWLSPRAQWIVGAVLFPIGLAATAVTLYQPSLALFLVAAAFAGAGAGLLFKGGVARAAMAAQPESRAGVLAWFFVIAYIGMGAPSVAFAEITLILPIEPVMIAFAAVFSLAAAAVVWLGNRPRTR